MLRKQVLLYFTAIVVGCLFCQEAFCDDMIPRENSPLNWQSDAELTDVFFINEKIGWVVGAQGVVLRTTNGGQDWLEISQADPTEGSHLSLSEKFQAMRSGTQTPWTGVANGSNSQFEPIRCRFESVYFVDAQHGWIAGGYDLPYVDHSRGFVLKTSDGGISWRPVAGLFMSRIHRIHFSDRANGWAIGETSSLFPTGIGFTSDGGESWSSHTSVKLEDWTDGDQTSAGFVNIDVTGQSVVVKNNQMERSVMLPAQTAQGNRLNRIRMLDGQQGWAIGSHGSVMQTNNGGLSWSSLVSLPTASSASAPETTALNNLLRQFDFKALSISPGKICIAGNPGSVVFSIDRTTGAISTSTTGVALPINDLQFVDDDHGWAVGALGMILSTADGGESWQIQNGKYRSVALLGVASSENEIPLEALANFAGEENRVVAASVMQSSVSASARQSTERLGCAVLMPIGSFIDQAHRDARLDTTLEAMVRVIRTFRPNVIVSNSRLRTAVDDPETFLDNAIRAAADRTAFPDQIELAHLQTWSVDRLAVRDRVGTVTLDPKRMLPRTGSLIEDKIALSRALLELPLAVKAAPAYRIEYYSVANHAQTSDLFAGLVEVGRSVPTRNSEQGFRGSLNAIQLANSKQNKLDEFAKFELNGSQDLRVWNQQMLSWSLSLDGNVAGVWLVQLAERYLEQGKTELAANTFEVLANRLYDHPLAPAAITWLVQYYASDEFGQIAFRRWIQSRELQTESVENRRVGNIRLGSPATEITQTFSSGASQLVWTPVADPVPLADIRPASGQSQVDNELVVLQDDVTAELNLTNSESDNAASNSPSVEEIDAFFNSRWQRAGQLLAQLGQRVPDLVGGVQFKILEAQIIRKLNGTLAAEAILKQLVLARAVDSSIAMSAKAELDLAGTEFQSASVSALTCFLTDTRPRLDGSINDAVWQSSAASEAAIRLIPMQPHSNIQPQPDTVMFAHDDQFLYVAARCQKLVGQYYQTSDEARPRDADLVRRDRISFAFDVDRDYRSTIEFVVDYRGWCHDQCSGAVGWNPEWFISQSADDSGWNIELAIPLNQIVSQPIAADSVWSMRLARMVDGNTNLWKHNQSENAASAMDSPRERTGIQIGLAAQPAEFRLLRFK